MTVASGLPHQEPFRHEPTRAQLLRALDAVITVLELAETEAIRDFATAADITLRDAIWIVDACSNLEGRVPLREFRRVCFRWMQPKLTPARLRRALEVLSKLAEVQVIKEGKDWHVLRPGPTQDDAARAAKNVEKEAEEAKSRKLARLRGELNMLGYKAA